MSSSPTAKKALKVHLENAMATMTFPQAIQAVIDGKRITKLEWGNPEDWCELRDTWLKIRRNGTWFVWQVNDGDMLGADWIVLE